MARKQDDNRNHHGIRWMLASRGRGGQVLRAVEPEKLEDEEEEDEEEKE